MSSQALHSTHYSYEQGSNLTLQCVEIEDYWFERLRSMSFGLLKKLRFESESIHVEFRDILTLVKPLINLKYLPIEISDDEYGFGEVFLKNIEGGQEYIADKLPFLKDEFDSYVEEALQFSEHYEINPIRAKTKELLLELSHQILDRYKRKSNFEPLILIPYRGKHLQLWQSLFGEIVDECFPVKLLTTTPSSLRKIRCDAVFTIGPMHLWDSGRQGWPDWFRTAPSSNILGNVRWRGDYDRRVVDMYIQDPPRWKAHIHKHANDCSEYLKFQQHKESLAFEMWDSSLFEDLYAGDDHLAISGHADEIDCLETENFQACVHTAYGDDLIIESEDYEFWIGLMDAAGRADIVSISKLFSADAEYAENSYLLRVFDDAFRKNVNEEARLRVDIERKKRRRNWKSRLRDWLDSDSHRAVLIAALRKSSSNDSILCNENNLDSWSETDINSIHAPQDPVHFQLILDAIGLGDQFKILVEDVYHFRGAGQSAGARAGSRVREYLKSQLENMTGEEQLALGQGQNIVRRPVDTSLSVEISGIESFRIYSTRTTP